MHVSLNPAPEDRLDDGQLAEIAGPTWSAWAGEVTTYIGAQAYRHRTEHIHIVSVQVAQTGAR